MIPSSMGNESHLQVKRQVVNPSGWFMKRPPEMKRNENQVTGRDGMGGNEWERRV